MRSFSRFGAVLLTSVAMAACGAPAQVPAEIAIRATPVALDPADPARTRIGALRYLGGWVLASRDDRFGGISALHADRGDFTALTDQGVVITFHLDSGGRIGGARAVPLPAVPIDTAGRRKTDSESMQRDPATGHIWVGFEGANAIWRYEPEFAAPGRLVEPTAMSSWPSNGGPEAMARLADGRFIVFAEEAAEPAGATEALLYAGDPTIPGMAFVRIGYRAPEGYRVTDATALPDGRLILVNRRFTITEGVSAVLTVADPRAVVAGGVIEPREIARLAPPLTVDNMEAVSVEQEAGRTIVWLASDDNFIGVQRTLLLKFALEAVPR